MNVADALMYGLVGGAMASALFTCVAVIGDAWAGRDPWEEPLVVFPAVVDPDGLELPPPSVLQGGAR